MFQSLMADIQSRVCLGSLCSTCVIVEAVSSTAACSV